MELIRLVPSQGRNVHLQFKVLNHSEQTVLFFVQPEQILLQIQPQMQLVSPLLNHENRLLYNVVEFEFDQGHDPLLEHLILPSTQPTLQSFASFSQLTSLLLGFPVVAKDFTDPVLVKFEF